MSDLEQFFRWAKIDSSDIKLSDEKSYPLDFIGYHIHHEFINTTKFNNYYNNGELLFNGNILHFQLNTKNQNENTHSWKIISCVPYEIKKNKTIKNVWFVYMNPIDYDVDEEEYMNPAPIKEYKKKAQIVKKPPQKLNTPNIRKFNSNTSAWMDNKNNKIKQPPQQPGYKYLKKTTTTVTEQQLIEQFEIENQIKKDLNFNLNALKHVANGEEQEESKTNDNDNTDNEEEQEESKANDNDNTDNEEEKEESKTNDNTDNEEEQEESKINENENADNKEEQEELKNQFENIFKTWKLDIRNNNESESNFKLAIPFSKEYLKSKNGKIYRQIWMSQYNTWHLMYGKCIDAPIVPDNFITLHNDIEKWDEWDATYDKWFFDFMSTNIMK